MRIDKANIESKLALWQRRLKIEDYAVYVVFEDSQYIISQPHINRLAKYIHGGIVRGDCVRDYCAKLGFIRLYTPLCTEETLVHELLHLKHPKQIESWIEHTTDKYLQKYES